MDKRLLSARVDAIALLRKLFRERSLSQRETAQRIFPNAKTVNSAASFFNQVLMGRRALPELALENVMKEFGLTRDKLEPLLARNARDIGGRVLTTDDLMSAAKEIEALGRTSITMDELVDLVNIRRKPAI